MRPVKMWWILRYKELVPCFPKQHHPIEFSMKMELFYNHVFQQSNQYLHMCLGITCNRAYCCWGPNCRIPRLISFFTGWNLADRFSLKIYKQPHTHKCTIDLHVCFCLFLHVCLIESVALSCAFVTRAWVGYDLNLT